MLRAGAFIGKTFQLLQHPNGVLIHGVGVKQIELHLSDDMAPQRRISPQHAIAMHRHQRPADRAGMAQNRHKGAARFRNLTQRLFKMTTRMAQVTQGGGVDPFDAVITHHDVEHAQDCLRLSPEQRFVAQVDQIATQLEIVINRPGLFVGGERQNRLIKQLQQHLIQFADTPRDPIEIFHHPLDRLIALALIIQALCHAELAIKQQAIIVAGQGEVQGKADAPEKCLTFVEFAALRVGEETKADHLIQRGGAKMASGDPLQRMNVPQATGAAFNVRFKVIAGAVITLVALLLLFNFGGEKAGWGPETVAEDVFL